MGSMFSNLISPTKEHFDVYYNHDVGASKVLKIPPKKANLWSKYHWNDRDPDGLSVYDKYYESILSVKNSAPHSNPESATTNYSIRDVQNFEDPYPKFIIFNGEKIVLSQKNF